ncbi:MAG: DUF1926 domain-containing protein [Spirochaetales bacterium]|nr:DUF1926 domain-containing protein [Spirochaetales bacterium]
MSKTRLVLGIINSQPLGLQQDYYEAVYQNYYKPCLTVLSEFPDIPFVLYYSGPLLDWLEVKHPEATMLINDMVKRKQVELLGGGFYEPLLSIIPNSDRSGHIELQTIQIRKRFGRRPRGGWIGEMVWEPGLPLSLKNSGLDYTFLDDTYLKAAGVKSDEMNYPCLTEEQGKTIMIFPLDSELKSYLLENSPADSFAYLKLRLKSLEKKDPRGRIRVLSLFFKGEEWNGVEGGSRLRELLVLLQKNRKELNIDLPSHYTRVTTPLKKIYFPALMPGKMIHDKKDIPRHDTARSLVTTYPEINLLYSKLLYVNNQIRQIRGDKSRKKSAQLGIWKAQQNRIFWYPKDEGNTYRYVRQSAYHDLIQAEIHSRESGIFQPNMVKYDFTMKGTPDFMFQGTQVNAYISSEGAKVFELDYLPKPWNYQDTICHWAETQGNRDSFIETFYSDEDHPRKNVNSKGFSLESSYFELEEFDKDKNVLIFTLDTRIPDIFGKKHAVTLIKKYVFKKNGLNVNYEIKNNSDTVLEFYFTTEININFATDVDKTIIEYVTRGVKKSSNDPNGNYRDLKSLQVKDVKNKCLFSLNTSKNSDLIKTRREIVDENFGPLYQGTKFMFGWKKKAEPHKSWGVELGLRLDKI